MLLYQQNFLPQYYNRGEYPSFQDYLDEQTEDLLSFLQNASENQCHPIRRRMDGASEEEIEAELLRWQNRQICQFQDRLRQELQQRRIRTLKRRLHQAKDQLQSTLIELDQSQANLAIERHFTAQLKEQWRCRGCNAMWWD